MLDKKNWEYIEIEDEEYSYYYYHKYKTDFLIKFSHYNTSDKKEAYSYLMYNPSTHYRRIDLIYNQVILLQISCVILDSGRYKTSIERAFRYFFKDSNQFK
ncbi:hypothetical protein GNF85_14025 [Clostridium perfringens]